MLDTYRELVDLLVQTPTQLKEAAERAGPPPDGEWGAAQVLAHLASSEKFWLARLNTIMHQRNGLLHSRPSPEIRAYGEALMSGSVGANLEAFNQLRGETISLMMGLSLNDWARTGTHETRGEITVEAVVENMVDHDAEHLDQLKALAAPSLRGSGTAARHECRSYRRGLGVRGEARGALRTNRWDQQRAMSATRL